MNVLSVDRLSFAYRKNTPVLTDVSFSVGSGEILCLLGPNGCGKSTLLTQILFPGSTNKRHISLLGKPVDSYSVKEKSRHISYVSQKMPPVPLSVLQTVIMGRNPYISNPFLKPGRNDYEIAERIICELGLERYIDTKVSALSGGEIQRVFIAQSLTKNADLYIFDEPMSALDPEYQTGFLSLIKELSGKGASVIFTTHNPNHLFSLDGVRCGVINSDHRYTELDISDPRGRQKTEELFNGSVQIRYSSEHGAYVSLFKTE